jgi:signal transduction histidine kinase
MTTAAVTLAQLRAVDLFDGIDDGELAEWVAVARVQELQPGELIAEQNDDPPGLILLLDGTAQAELVGGTGSEPVGRQQAPTWIGAIAVLTGGPMPVRMRTETPCRLAIVEPADFRRLVFEQPAVHQTVMRQVAPVMQRLYGIEQNRERLASLGTMAAGLAHELNNPAAAARRAASQMTEELRAVNATLARFVESGIERREAEQLVALQREAVARAAAATAMDTLDAADAEDDLLARLEALGVPSPWLLAEPLAAAGVDQGWLDRVAELAGPATDAALRWVTASLTIERLGVELCQSTEQIASLVGAVKSYAYMDRGGLVEVDLHEGLETTLTVLGHKLKHVAVKVRRDYDRALPRITVRGSELNQVWTNLLDNAIDAVGGEGTITISTRRDGDCAVVAIADDGEGIPADVRERIFDPFFTTKDVGLGTGLGLSTARRIVVDRHNGSLGVESRPGRTTFSVRLPLAQASTPPAAPRETPA